MDKREGTEKKDYALTVVDPTASTRFVLLEDELAPKDPYHLLTFEQLEEGKAHIAEVNKKYPYVRGNDPSMRYSEHVPYRSISLGVLIGSLLIPTSFILLWAHQITAGEVADNVLNMIWWGM